MLALNAMPKLVIEIYNIYIYKTSNFKLSVKTIIASLAYIVLFMFHDQ